MAIEWSFIGREIYGLIKILASLISQSNSTRDLLLIELDLNLKFFENAKSKQLSYDQLITLLSNQEIKNAIQKGFIFKTIKVGKVQAKHIINKRNKRYKGKDCKFLFIKILETIDELKGLKQANKSLSNFKGNKIPLKFSNLYYKMKLLIKFIR